jgi:hypothetical protein
VLKKPSRNSDADERECNCACHKGVPIVHVVACCEANVLEKKKPTRNRAADDIRADEPERSMIQFAEGLKRVFAAPKTPSESARLNRRRKTR